MKNLSQSHLLLFIECFRWPISESERSDLFWLDDLWSESGSWWPKYSFFFGILKRKWIFPFFRTSMIWRDGWFDEVKVESNQPSLEILRKSNFLVHIRWDNPHLLLRTCLSFVFSSSLNETNDLSKLCWWATIYLLWMIKLDRGFYHFIDGCLVDGMSLQRPWLVFNQRK